MSWAAKAKEKQILEKLYCKTRYYAGIYRNDKRGGLLVRGYPYSTNHDNVKKWWRKHSNRKFRRYSTNMKEEEMDILNRGYHKKQFDLWWTLY